jgi:cell division transport system permease protein
VKRWFTEHRFALSDVLARLAKEPLSVALNVGVVAIALALPLFGFVVLQSLRPVTAQLASEPEMGVFMTLDATREEARALSAPLAALPGVSGVRFVAKEDALADMKNRPGMTELLSALPGNPLPDAWIVRLNLNTDDISGSERQAQLVAAVSALPKVDHVQVDAVWVKRMESMMRLLSLVLWIVASALGIAVVAVIFNTVRLQVLTQREEIELAKLIGATNRFVRRPFYYMGLLQGLLGGAIGLGLVALLLVPLNQALFQFTRLYVSSLALSLGDPRLLAAFLIVSAFLGWIAAVLSVSKHLGRY